MPVSTRKSRRGRKPRSSSPGWFKARLQTLRAYQSASWAGVRTEFREIRLVWQTHSIIWFLAHGWRYSWYLVRYLLRLIVIPVVVFFIALALLSLLLHLGDLGL